MEYYAKREYWTCNKQQEPDNTEFTDLKHFLLEIDEQGWQVKASLQFRQVLAQTQS